LPATSTAVTGVRMVPVVGVVREPRYRPNREEVEAVIEVPLEEVLRPGALAPTEVFGFPTYAFESGQGLVWGATARVLKGLAEAVSRLRSARGG
jgi:hypothetical protein